MYFNTSHVVVYHYRTVSGRIEDADFNTSHVVVYPEKSGHKLSITSYFNTSHVVVYLAVKWNEKKQI